MSSSSAVVALAPMATAAVAKTALPAISSVAKAALVSGILGYRGPPSPQEPSNDWYKAWLTQVSSPIRFFISGNLGNFAFFIFEALITRYLLQKNYMKDLVFEYGKETLAFYIAYLMQIVVQHTLHAYLVYGAYTINTFARYAWTLAGESVIYIIALFASTNLNMWMLRNAEIDKIPAFLITMISSAVFNYLLVGTWVRWVIEWTPPKPVVTKKSTKVVAVPPPPPPVVTPLDVTTTSSTSSSSKNKGALVKRSERTAAAGAIGATLLAGGLAIATSVFAGEVVGKGSDSKKGSKKTPSKPVPPPPPPKKAALPAPKKPAPPAPKKVTPPPKKAALPAPPSKKAAAEKPAGFGSPQLAFKSLLKSVGIGSDTEGMDIDDLEIDGSTIDRPSK